MEFPACRKDISRTGWKADQQGRCGQAFWIFLWAQSMRTLRVCVSGIQLSIEQCSSLVSAQSEPAGSEICLGCNYTCGAISAMRAVFSRKNWINDELRLAQHVSRSCRIIQFSITISKHRKWIRKSWLLRMRNLEFWRRGFLQKNGIIQAADCLPDSREMHTLWLMGRVRSMWRMPAFIAKSVRETVRMGSFIWKTGSRYGPILIARSALLASIAVRPRQFSMGRKHRNDCGMCIQIWRTEKIVLTLEDVWLAQNDDLHGQQIDYSETRRVFGTLGG